MPNEHLMAGPVYQIAEAVLRKQPEFSAFRNGELSRARFATFLDQMAATLHRAGLPPDDVQFAKRYPASDATFVDDWMRRLAAAGIVPTPEYDRAAFRRAAAAARRHFHHGPFATYIYPEEARLLFAVCDVLRPHHTVVLGSYYGYWAYWAAAAVARHGGRLVLVDPDSRAQAVARKSFARLGLSRCTEIIEDTGEAYLTRCAEPVDCVVLDAELPRTGGNPLTAGKSIYAVLLHAALERTRPGAALICHNILFHDIAGAEFFTEIINRNERELAAFLALVSRCCDGFVECTSTEGVGVGRLRRDR
jgi:predicted O-methyltransferase YrrM